MIDGYLENGVYYCHNGIVRGRTSLVFIHGLSGCCSAWRPYAERFGDHCNVVFFDLRGHGRSIKKNGIKYYSLDDIAADIFCLASTLELDNFVLIGHSFGALLALDFANKYPKMASSLILLAPDYRISKTLRAKIARPFLAASRVFLLKPFRERTGIHIDYTKFINTGDWDAKRIYTDIRNTSLRVYCYCLRQMDGFDGEKLVARIKIPTLIIHGDRDTVFPVSDSIDMAKNMPGSKLKILPGANHILVMNNSKEVGDEIEDFIKPA